MKTIYIGIDNGVTGSIAVLSDVLQTMVPTPTISQLNYTKAKANVSRLNYPEFKEMLEVYLRMVNGDRSEILVLVERPMLNPGRLRASISAMRCLEATLIALELVGLPYQYEDSRKWQKAMLPAGIKGAPQLKEASRQVGNRLFPQLSEAIRKQKDADSLLMAEYARRAGL